MPEHKFPSYVGFLGESIAGITSMAGLKNCGGGKGLFDNSGGDDDVVSDFEVDSYYTEDTEDERGF